jgi:hypothetical protein
MTWLPPPGGAALIDGMCIYFSELVGPAAVTDLLTGHILFTFGVNASSSPSAA